MTMTLSGTSGGIGVIGSGTAVASTSGTSIDFTGLPAGLKRITVMFSGVSTSGTSPLIVRVGDSGGVSSTNYKSMVGVQNVAGAGLGSSTSTAGFLTAHVPAGATTYQGILQISTLGGNVWAASGTGNNIDGTAYNYNFSGACSLSGTLDRVRITTVNGTDTFDAGSINILYE